MKGEYLELPTENERLKVELAQAWDNIKELQDELLDIYSVGGGVMKNGPSLIHAEEFRNYGCEASINGQWFLARPKGTGWIVWRIKLAWGVLCGKYDALKWGGNQ